MACPDVPIKAIKQQRPLSGVNWNQGSRSDPKGLTFNSILSMLFGSFYPQIRLKNRIFLQIFVFAKAQLSVSLNFQIDDYCDLIWAVLLLAECEKYTGLPGPNKN